MAGPSLKRTVPTNWRGRRGCVYRHCGLVGLEAYRSVPAGNATNIFAVATLHLATTCVRRRKGRHAPNYAFNGDQPICDVIQIACSTHR